MKRKSSIPFKEMPDQERSVVSGLPRKAANLSDFSQMQKLEISPACPCPSGMRAVGRLREISGMTMMEIVISLFIIGLAAIVAASIIISAFQGNRVNKNKLIAISLAREGIEAVRNMRDSNWLRYAANKKECWNFWEDPEASPTPITTCNTASLNRITAGYYKVNIGRYDLGPSFTPPTPPYTYKWYLSDAGDLATGTPIDNLNSGDAKLENLELKYIDLNQSADGVDPDTDTTNDIESSIYTAYSTTNSWDGNLNATNPPFYRQIQIEYIDTNGGGPTVDDESLQVTSTVVWFEKGQKKKVKLISRLSNYMD